MNTLILENVELKSGKHFPSLQLSYECFGPPLGTAPVVLATHALTGNSTISGINGWWNSLIGSNKAIDTQHYTVIGFNIPGNLYDGIDPIGNYSDFVLNDVAVWFWQALDKLNVSTVFAGIGGSLGGGLLWEMAALQPSRFQYLIPIATHWKSSDWVIANTLVQEQILLNSSQPIHDARLHAMLLYRTPQSFQEKFNRNPQPDSSMYQIESWLLHHGKKLQERFTQQAYLRMNQFLKTINVTDAHAALIQSNIYIISITTDYLFTDSDCKNGYTYLKNKGCSVHYHTIESIHGHDAFLIEYSQLSHIIKPIFNTIL